MFFHHPLPGSEFASRYDYDRLLDVLHGYNIVLLMAGHSHGHVYRAVEGLDQTTGGSTFGPNAGFAVISVKGGVLRVAYWKAGDPAPSLKLLEKPIPARSSYPEVEIRCPYLPPVGRKHPDRLGPPDGPGSPGEGYLHG